MTLERDIRIKVFKDDLEGAEMVTGMVTLLSEDDDHPEYYGVVINGRKDERTQTQAFIHELLHIWHKDLHNKHLTANQIETMRHKETAQMLDALQIGGAL